MVEGITLMWSLLHIISAKNYATIHPLKHSGLNMFDNEHRGVKARHPNMTKGSSRPG